VQTITQLVLCKKFDDDKVILTKEEINRSDFKEALKKLQDLNRPLVIVASMAFTEAILPTEASTVIIMEPQDRQNTQDQFLFRVYRLGQLADVFKDLVMYIPESDLETGLLGAQSMKTVSQNRLQSGETVEGTSIDWNCNKDRAQKLELLTYYLQTVSTTALNGGKRLKTVDVPSCL
jgi:hypothetical protein